MKARRVGAIMQKELRQLRRDRVTLAMIVMVLVMQLILFGYAINFNLRGLDAGIADQANTSASRALVMDMLATDVVKPVLTAQTPQQLTRSPPDRPPVPRTAAGPGILEIEAPWIQR